MLGARFLNHPKQQTATLDVHHDCADAHLGSHLGSTWRRFDEWYDFREPVPTDACVLLTVRRLGTQRIGQNNTFPLGTFGSWVAHAVLLRPMFTCSRLMPATPLSRRRFVAAASAAVAGALTPASLVAQTGPTAPAARAAPRPSPPPSPVSPGVGPAQPIRLGMVLFEGFQLLDVFGPLEMFSHLRDRAQIVLLAERAGPVKGSGGVEVVATRTLMDPGPLDVLMVPGGGGTRREVNNAELIAALKSLSEATPHVASVCTGSALLARAGLLDDRRATSNKRAYAWATSQGPRVIWVPEARWVEDGKFFTSSGISAGMDMALGLITKLFDRATAERIAAAAEYTWHADSAWDPFAKLNGLVP